MAITPALKRCPRANCGGSVALVADERSDVECEWKCLMCARSFVAQVKVPSLHLQTGYLRQLGLWPTEPVKVD